MFTVLMTCAGGEMVPQAITYAQNSVRHDVRVVAVDADEKALGRNFADGFYQVPLSEDAEYIPVMLEIAKVENVDLIIPGSDEEALMLAKSRSDFEALSCQVACPAYETLEVLCNKAETYKRLVELDGIELPVWEEHTQRDDLIEATKKIMARCGGVVLKPAVARGGRDIIVIGAEFDAVETVENARELRMGLQTFLNDYSDFYQAKFPVVVMQRLAEPVHDVDMLSMGGDIYQTVPRRRVHSAAPNEGHIVLADEKLIKMAEIIIREFNLSWLQDIDAMYDDKGNPYILEINPRPSGSYSVSVAAGVPLIDDIISLAKGEGVGDRILPENVRIIPFKSLKAI